MKIKRNETCPCGSGKKYKKCCMNKTTARHPNDIPEEMLSTTLFGYSTPRSEDESPFDLPAEGMCCMVAKVDKQMAEQLNHDLDTNSIKVGQWVVTTNRDDKVLMSGPFSTMQHAMDVARTDFGAIRFVSMPDFIA